MHESGSFDSSLLSGIKFHSNISSATSCGFKLSNIPSDATTKYLSFAVKTLQPVNSGSAITPNLQHQSRSILN
jgi:hypothetical protein